MRNEIGLIPWSEGQMLLRLLCATIAGGLIGWNRHRAGKPAGIGTYALVALGAGLFVAIPADGGEAHIDALSRAIQGVAAGQRVVGLTSAAALWGTAGLGLTIVAGPLAEALVATVLIVAILELAPRIERWVGDRPDQEHQR